MSAAGRWERDDHLLRILDDGLDEARRRAGDAAVCRAGCFGCCLGPFPITMQDAARLRRGLDAMEQSEPERAGRLRERAAEAMLAMRPGFPGDWLSGILDEARAAEELYSARYEMIPCPALQLETGACELYEYRPVACRTFGLAVRVSGVDLAPCRLNYTGMSAAEIEARRVELHLEAIDSADVEVGQTVIAAALRHRPPCNR
ncbi:MAG: YkgJ family cysteine cluster protein [Acidobacteriota bacterium]